VERAAARLAGGGLLCCALDTELLGHWWYEGPLWLEEVLAEAPRRGLRLATVSEGLDLVQPAARPLAASSWGRGKDLSTWDAPAVAEFAFAARAAELRTVAAAASGFGSREALARAARELLALQSSDWAFMRSRGLAGDYPRERVRNHTLAFGEALSAIRPSMTDFRAMNGGPHHQGSDERLRGLAPGLELSPLLGPSSMSQAGGR
jgi:1,4-alpha-glucan branching enzyme